QPVYQELRYVMSRTGNLRSRCDQKASTKDEKASVQRILKKAPCAVTVPPNCGFQYAWCPPA
ncbi:hypothetical protein, partial [Actinomadura roseirufa]|uniref:hypothetical protein n=1 Tax=Actinomadura roseirufa TaxID=2094049 RepID=UPI001A955DA6